MTIREMEQALQANGNGSTTYTVVAGDTFNAIAYANDMSVSDLKALNPSVDINRLMVGDVLNVKELTPLLSVETVDDVTYVESIPCPVEEVKDSSLYKGSSKIITQGVEGEAQVDATITYVNGQETGRVINSTTTLREPTKTVKAVGTKEKPKTASSGSYQWPIRGADHLLLRRPVYFWQLQLSLRDRYFRLLWCGHPGCRWRYSHLCGL